MPKIDPELLALLQRRAYYQAHPEEAERSPGAVPDPQKIHNISIQFKGKTDELKAVGFNPGSVIGPIAYGATTLKILEKLADHSNVLSIEKQRRDHIQLIDSIPDIKADQVWNYSGGGDFSGFTGKDIIVGIVDTGIDFHHGSFRKPDGSTRILRIWDQTLTQEGSDDGPDPITDTAIGNIPLGYGVEYTKDQIDDTLQNEDSSPVVRHEDKNGHGTHVAGIAAGNGSQAGACRDTHTYVGVAPEADIIMVRKWGLTEGDANEPETDTGTTVDAISYILNLAKHEFHKPVVINLSLGAFTEKMDGSSDDSIAIDHLLTSTAQDNGFAIVFSAGNYADENFHAKANVPAGSTGNILELQFEVLSEDSERRWIAIVYSGTNLEVQVTSPVEGDDGIVEWVGHGSYRTSTTANGPGNGSVNVSHAHPDLVYIDFEPDDGEKNRNGTWKIELKDTGNTETPIDAFCLFGSSHDDKSIYFLDHTTVLNTLNYLATGKEVISVGAYRVSQPASEEQLANFSSRGLTLDLQLKPEITAPGVSIHSASIESHISNRNCCCDCLHDFYVNKSGTSMAAPHVAGSIALMLQKNPNLTHRDIRGTLTSTTRPIPSSTTLEEDMGWGTGKLDIKAAVDAVVAPGGGGGTGPHAPYYKPVSKEKSKEAELFERFQRSKRGQELIDLFHRYFYEIRDLINTNKKVATVWHRSKGPLWVRAAIRAASSPALPIPVEVEGFSLWEGITRMLSILRRFGSDMLVRDLDKYEDELLLIKEGMNVYQLMDVFTEPVSV